MHFVFDNSNEYSFTGLRILDKSDFRIRRKYAQRSILRRNTSNFQRAFSKQPAASCAQFPNREDGRRSPKLDFAQRELSKSPSQAGLCEIQRRLTVS